MSADPEQIKLLFNQALGLRPEDRAAFLAQACGGDDELRARVELLLKVQKGVPDPPPPGTMRISDDTIAENVEPSTEQPGSQIGRYKLLQVLGEGGMGSVWMAEQKEPVRRHVALKVIKLGMDTKEVIARFEAERQALALMDHPNIAKVLDGGVTDSGRPYFVMELVKGVPIDTYCDEHKLRISERLQLFRTVCEAIQHAHQKGIIHRDLKPGNVLVAEQEGKPLAKVIDFGLAKALGSQLTEKTLYTALGSVMGTPQYMSPEQASGSNLDVDTRTDIYSLGVMLYELLTGTTPLTRESLRQAAHHEVLRRIREEEPARPSTRLAQSGEKLTTISATRKTEPGRLTKSVSGDLDWIVMKALEKERNRRYETANDFAADILRHLSNEPVAARPPSNLYRFQKTIRRHKLAFTAAIAVLVSLILGLGATTVMFFNEQAVRRSVTAARTEVVHQKLEVDRKNTEYRAMLAEAGRSDRLVAQENLRSGNQPAAFAYLSRASTYEPSSTLAAETAIAELNSWKYPLPTTILTGHDDFVSGGGFGPDGTRILIGSKDGTVRIWDAPTGSTISTLAHPSGVYHAEFNLDGSRILTASKDSTARIWDAGTGKILVSIAGQEGSLRLAVFSPDGTRVVTASTGLTARVWDAATGKALATLDGHGDFIAPQGINLQGVPSIAMVRFSPDSARIITASVDKTARVWDAATGKPVTTLEGHSDAVVSAVFSPDGRRILTASWDKTARVWDATTGKLLTTLVGHTELVQIALFCPDGRRIVTASQDKTARVWQTGTGKELVRLSGHVGLLQSVEFNSDGTRIITASDDKTARVWQTTTGKMLAVLAGHKTGVFRAQFSPVDTCILSVSSDDARIWDEATWKTLPTLEHTGSVSRARVFRARFSHDGARIVTTAFEDSTARVWDAATGTPLATLAGHEGAVLFADFSADGTRFITTSVDKTARLWDTATWKPLTTLAGHTSAVEFAAFSPDRTRIVTGSNDKTARIWDVMTGKTLATLAGHKGEILALVFSPDGTRIITLSSDNSGRLWDAATGNSIAILAHTAALQWAEFSRDGSRIATASSDRTARVWDGATGKALATLAGHNDTVLSARFSINGTRIVTASADKTSRLWNGFTGEPIALLSEKRNDERLRINMDNNPVGITAEFSPDGNRVVTALGGNTVQVWEAAAGKALFVAAEHQNFVTDARFSPDGARIITASMDETARIWETTTGKMLVRLPHAAALYNAKYSPDGTRILTRALPTFYVWNVLPPSAGAPPEWFPGFLLYMAQMRLSPDGELETLKAADWLALRERLRAVRRASASADTPYLRILRKYVSE